MSSPRTNYPEYLIKVEDTSESSTENTSHLNKYNNFNENQFENNDYNKELLRNDNEYENNEHNQNLSSNTLSQNSTNYSDALSNNSDLNTNSPVSAGSSNNSNQETHFSEAHSSNLSTYNNKLCFTKNNEIMINIFRFLSSSEIRSFMIINRRWLYIANHPRVWHERDVFSPGHEEQLKFELLWFIIDKEVDHIINSPKFNTINNSMLLRFVYQTFSNFPLYVHKGEEFQNRIRNFFTTIPKLLIDIKVATKKDIVTDFKELLLLLFDNLLRTPFRKTINEYVYTQEQKGFDQNDVDTEDDIDSFNETDIKEEKNKKELNNNYNNHKLNNNNNSNNNTKNNTDKFKNDELLEITEEGEGINGKHNIVYDRAEDEQENIQDTESIEYQKNVSERAAVATKLVQRIIIEIQQAGGLRLLSDNFKSCSTVEELPETYQQLFDATRTIMIDMLFTELSDERAIKKLKTIHTLTPVLAIKGVLSVTNPLRIVNGMFSLFLARPFGSRSLVQRIMEVVVEINKTKSAIKEFQQLFIKESGLDKNEAKLIIQYITNYTDKLDFQTLLEFTDNEDYGIENTTIEEKRKLMQELLRSSTTSSSSSSSSSLSSFFFTPSVVKLSSEYNSNQIKMMYDMYRYTVRLRQKKLLIDLLGSEEIIVPLKQLAQVTLDPLMDFYAVGHIGGCISVFSNTISEIIKTAQLKDNEEKEYRYANTLQQAEKELYRLFIHPIFVSKSNVMEELVFWVADLIDFLNIRTIQPKRLYEQLQNTNPKKAFCMREALTKSWEEREKQGGVDAPLPNGYSPDLGIDSHYVKTTLVPEFSNDVKETLNTLTQQLQKENETIKAKNQ